MGTIASIVYKPANVEQRPEDHFARVPLTAAELIAGYGIADDQKGGGEDRHLNIMAAETLTALVPRGFRVQPGQMGEQITTTGLAIDALQPGDKLYIGAVAVVEVVEPRRGCNRFQRIQGHHPSEAAGMMGVMARVIQGGLIQVGDTIRIEAAAAEAAE